MKQAVIPFGDHKLVLSRYDLNTIRIIVESKNGEYFTGWIERYDLESAMEKIAL